MPPRKIKTFDDYQQLTTKTARYPDGEDGMTYLVEGLASESGEVFGKLKRILRGDYKFTDKVKKEIGMELGDVCWYWAQILLRNRISMGKFIINDIDTFNKKHYDDVTDRYLHRNTSILYRNVATYVDSYFVGRITATKLQIAFMSSMTVIGIMANQIGLGMDWVINKNISKLSARKKKNTIKGTGDGVTGEGRISNEVQTTEHETNSEEQMG